ncbi:SARP family transcriptional regulator [Actinoplanes sp. OR16]|uniref:ATP-binding protein n=1 Tax=Actinoplanes sp. OR16 TaxID=946334 RepID=UPI000F6ECE00|nr:BTAD domain-containing putative transcriptional regulator [Actinoplanes sp. OR16]BBH71133.1 SARP family transcriptional regulator [Actinoplanes sp. OR16]
MRFGILGPLRVELPGGRLLPLGGPRLRALLAMLLLDAGRPVGVERLIDGLYGSRPPAGAANALQSQVSRLRQSLPVEHGPAGYRIAVAPDTVDAHRFTALASEGRRALPAGDPGRAVTVLREALELWQGDALADVRDAPFAASAADHLAELRVTASEDLAAALLATGADLDDAVSSLRALIAAHPLRERPRGLLMRALAAAGRSAEALSLYEETRHLLADQLGADPSPDLAGTHTAILRGAFAPVSTPQPARRGVPTALTSFVGRDDDLVRVTKNLATARLVTLHGPGGAGKTRLAAEVAARSDADCCFVELAAATSDDLPRAVLDALGLKDARLNDRTPAEAAAEAPAATDRLVFALADRTLLLILDNCEHVIEAAAALAGRLLAAAPGLRVLATSREPLGITGETLNPVGGLPMSPAVRLFADRAADVSPGFAVTGENADAIRRICRMLDGQPLAVELAAARLHALSLDEVASRLDDRFRLLSKGSRTAAGRHRTLHAVVAWSWDLLTPAEQVLARRFTVFTGGADLAAIEAVCAEPDVVDLLDGLVGKSLIERDGGRYRMLATIRAFCAERLDESGERQPMERAHAAYYLDLALTADPWLRTASQLGWLDRLDADRDNLHTALRRGDIPTALRLVSALSFYWWLRGLRSEATTLAARVLRAIGSEPPPGLTEEYALCVLNAALGGTRPTEPWDDYLRMIEEPPAQPFLLYLSAMAVGPPDAPPGDVVALNRQLRERLSRGSWINALGGIGGGWMLLFAGAGPEAAEPEFRSALDGFRALGERWGTMIALSGLAELAIWRGRPADALAPLDEALRLAEELGAVVDVADLLRSRAESRLNAGDHDGAAADFARAASRSRDCGARELEAAARHGQATVAFRRGDLPAALHGCAAALDVCPTGWYSADGTRMAILVTMGRIASAQGNPREAADRYRSVFSLRSGMLGFQVMAEAIDRLATLALDTGDPARAASLLGTVTALQLRTSAASGELASQVAARAAAELGPSGYAAALARGAALTPPEAFTFLRS